MTSLSTSPVVGSTSSEHSVKDAIESYRRSQYFAVDSNVYTPAISLERETNYRDEESLVIPESVTESEEEVEDIQELRSSDVPTGELCQNEEHDQGYQASQITTLPFRTLQDGHGGQPRETTPLLRQNTSFGFPRRPRRTSRGVHARSKSRPVASAASLLKSLSSTSLIDEQKYDNVGRSTFGQTLFNSIAILLGIGILSEPLAFAYSGWIGGTILIIGYGFTSCYTAKILAKIIIADPRVRSYADIARKAFGPRSTSWVSFMFCLELFSVSVVLVTLYADSLHAIIPDYSVTTYKLWGIVLLVPTIFLPLSLLSYTSILGIVSTLCIIIVILVDGFSKETPPGSLWRPAETTFGVMDLSHFGVAFGLFMAGFSGHAVIPSLARDMADPSQFDRMINWAFIIATFLYGLVGYVGYMMFGNSVSEEISMDLLNTPGYNANLNQAVLWMLVISPLSKFALTTQPLNATIEYLLGVDPPFAATQTESDDGSDFTTSSSFRVIVRCAFGMFQRISVTVLTVLVSILVPNFSSVMAFLGAFSAFILCVTVPVAAKVVLEDKCGRFDGCLLIFSLVMAVWGTISAFYFT